MGLRTWTLLLVLGCSSRQHVPLEEYSTNLERIVDYVKGIGCEHILLITPPPLDEIAWNRFQVCGINFKVTNLVPDLSTDHIVWVLGKNEWPVLVKGKETVWIPCDTDLLRTVPAWIFFFWLHWNAVCQVMFTQVGAIWFQDKSTNCRMKLSYLLLSGKQGIRSEIWCYRNIYTSLHWSSKEKGMPNCGYLFILFISKVGNRSIWWFALQLWRSGMRVQMGYCRDWEEFWPSQVQENTPQKITDLETLRSLSLWINCSQTAFSFSLSKQISVCNCPQRCKTNLSHALCTRVDNLPMDFPSHQEVDHLNPEASFQSKQEIIAASK